MTSDPVFWLVVGLQVGILIRCLFLASGDDSGAFDRLRKQFEEDITGRAKRGDGPDWVRYMDEADRVHERRIDRLRAWATAALVVGIGGTMLAIVVALFGTSGEELDDELITAVGPALVASLSGVVNNLFITLRLFRWSDGRFAATLDEFREALHNCSVKNRPDEEFAAAVRDQLGEAFRTAVSTFPDAFARLGEITEAQSKAAVTAATGLKESTDGLTSAAAEIAPVADLLRESTDRLQSLPDRLAQTLAEMHTRWEREVRSGQDSFIGGVTQVLDGQQALLKGARDEFEARERQQRAAVDRLQQAVSDIVKMVEELPATFTQEVGKTVDTMGKEFGLEARQHVEDLKMAVSGGNEALRKQIEETTRDLQNSFLNDTSKVVKETLDKVYREVERTLLSSLKDVGEGLREALHTLPKHADTFAASLSTADEKLQRSIERLTESAAHLERVATLTKQFEASLSRALQEATARSFKPLRSSMQEIVTELRRSAGLPGAPSGFLRRFFRRLTRRLRRDTA